jgi:hypothetical protein
LRAQLAGKAFSASLVEVSAVPLRCANDVKEGAVNVVVGRPAWAVKREFFHD